MLETIDKAANKIEQLSSKRYAQLFRTMVDKLRSNAIQDFFAVPASD